MFAALLGEHVTTLPRLMAAQADPGAVKRMCHALAGTAVECLTSRVNGQPGAPSLVGGMRCALAVLSIYRPPVVHLLYLSCPWHHCA